MNRGIAIIHHITANEHRSVTRNNFRWGEICAVDGGIEGEGELVARLQRSDISSGRTSTRESQALCWHVHVASSAWGVHHLQFARLAKGKRVVAIHIAHLHFSHIALVGALEVSGIVDAHGIVWSVGIHTTDIHGAVFAHDGATEVHITDSRHLVSIDGVLNFHTIHTLVNHTLSH